MSEEPKKIWVDDDWEVYEIEPKYSTATPYIRADLVDGLVEALETCLMYGGMTGDDWVSNKAENALDALKEMEER